jgi:hypothetical protein
VIWVGCAHICPERRQQQEIKNPPLDAAGSGKLIVHEVRLRLHARLASIRAMRHVALRACFTIHMPGPENIVLNSEG